MPKTWKILELGIEPAGVISPHCPHCGADADLPHAHTESPIIASIGLGLVFDNPAYAPPRPVLPAKIQCRHCRRVFVWKEVAR